MRTKGSWQKCELNKAHKRINMYYWRAWNRPFHFCDLCLDAIQKENNTGPYTLTNSIPINHRPDSKPEKDSL